MIKKTLTATIVGTIVYLIVGWIVFDFILGDYTNLHTTQLVGFKKEPENSSLTLLIVSCAAYAALMSFILVYLLNIETLFKALLIGAFTGILIAIMTDSYWYATSNFYSNVIVILLDIIGAGISVGVMGFSIALINKRLNN